MLLIWGGGEQPHEVRVVMHTSSSQETELGPIQNVLGQCLLAATPIFDILENCILQEVLLFTIPGKSLQSMTQTEYQI